MQSPVQARREAKWEYDVGERPIWWLAEQLAQDRLAEINRDLLRLIFDAMSLANLLIALRILARAVKRRLS